MKWTEVQSKNGLQWVKRFYGQDTSRRISVSTWRTLAFHEDISVGNFLTISDLMTTIFNHQVMLSSLRTTTIEVFIVLENMLHYEFQLY